jgi:PAS domain S-box-containing protein
MKRRNHRRAMSGPNDPLAVQPFDERLAAWLARCLDDDGASQLVLIEHDAQGRQLAPRVRAATHGASLGARVDDAVYAALVDGAEGGAAVAPSEALAVLGEAFAAAGARAYAVPVAPTFAQRADTLLCVTPPREVDAAVIDALARGLSRDREDRLARAAYDALQGSTDAMEFTDGDIRVMHVNRAWEALTGYARGEVVGRTLTFLRDPGAPVHDAAFYRYAEEVVDRQHAWASMLASRTKDGRRIMQEITVSRVDDARDHRLEGNLAVRRDLRQRAGREEALAIAHLEFRVVLSALPDGVAVLKGESVYFVNSAFVKLVGRGVDAVVGRPLRAFVHPDDRHLVPACLTREVVGLRVLRPDGSARFVEITGAGEVSFEGSPAQIALARDTTDQRVAAERTAHASRLTALGALAASIGHEINNPLAFVLGNLEALLNEAPPAARAGPLRDALEGTQRISAIVSDLRAFSRLEAPGALQAVDVAAAANVALNLVANQVRHRVTVLRSLAPGLFVRAQEGPLVQVLVNLLINAAQSIPERDGREHAIEVSARREGDRVAVRVRDTGVGIAPDVLPRIFAPFFTTRERDGGSGLGLSVSRRIIEGFGGTIEAESALHRGTTFTVLLPRAEGADEAAPAAECAPTAPPLRARVLVIDDEVPVARVLQRLLREHEVEVFHDGEAALERLRRAPPPDAVLCDLNMPGLTGPEVYEAVLRERPDVAEAFVFTTGGSFTAATAAFVEQHRDRVLEKPFRTQQVRDAVRRVTERSRRAP